MAEARRWGSAERGATGVALSPGGGDANPQPIVIGHDRDVDEVADRLAARGSVVVVGPLGSGKSYFNRAVVDALRLRGIRPVVVHAAAPLQSIRFGALKAAGDARIERLWTGSDSAAAAAAAAGAGPIVVVVDDAHALDPESIETLSRAVYTHQATVLLSVPSEMPGPARPATPAAITELWLEGGAQRYDLHPLDPDEAEELISAYGGGALDIVTRTALIFRASGSRMLLRELTIDAREEVAARRDPLDPHREETPGSRLSDAVSTMLSDFSANQLRALAIIGRLRGIVFASAARTVDPAVLASLITRKVVRTDDAPAPALFANPLLARAAERQLEAGELDAALDQIAVRALATPDVDSGHTIDQLVATFWLSQRPSVPPPGDVDAHVRCRILSSAARSANALGRADLALAYVDLALPTDTSPALQIEASKAHARMRRFREARASIDIEPATLSPNDLRRLVQWAAALGSWTDGAQAVEDLASWLARYDIGDSAAVMEVEMRRCLEAALQLEWTVAVDSAMTVLGDRGAHLDSRHGAALVCGVALSELGQADAAQSAFAEATRMNRDPITGRPLSISRELIQLCFEAFAAALADPGGPVAKPAPERTERLQAAIRLATERDDHGAFGLAGLAAGIVIGVQRDDARAAREFTAALKRFDTVEFAVWRPLVVYFQAGSLARLGEVEQARSAMSSIDHRVMGRYRLLRFVRTATEAETAAASGDLAAAQAAAVQSVQERSHGAPRERAAEFDAVHFDRILRLAAESRAGRTASGAQVEQHELTDREHEIALLVARQLSNKEIAQQLFLSVRTVESHIYTARGKLGARSRRELGRLVVENDTFRG
ncbi:MAG: LuxR family transcriptional regulator [Herbiconiux sp.]|uniref:helix-turn-helix transcriptional regulator n=1 Tax=Herbiconiux sp. TaxID=1871186 RepID=UPI0011FF4AAE|nr:LuxR C-terminal-related transcriptional regulator [Herbiconiux sp.]TAJ48634.1 MAG: LuxR family transcriptional regulator [Herbiconiux sp.]